MRWIWLLSLLAGFAHAQDMRELSGEYFYNIKAPFATGNKKQISKAGAKTARAFCVDKHYKDAIAFYYELIEGKTYKITDAFCSNEPKTLKSEALGRLVISRSRRDREATVATSAAELIKKLEGVEVSGFQAVDAMNGN